MKIFTAETQRRREFRKNGKVDSSFILHHSSFSSAFTLVELFLTIAVLMIVLGLMINLANRVRGESADRLTRKMLQHLELLMDNYIANNGGAVPELTPFLDSSPIDDESALQEPARQNNMDFLRCLNIAPVPIGKNAKTDELVGNLRKIGEGKFILEDAWGSPIVFMPRQDHAIGMAPADRPFFFSAGLDRMFLTREDNLYSYEEENGNRNDER